MKKNKSKYNYILILLISGVSIIALGFLGTFIFKNYDICFIGMLIGALLMIPDSWKLFINRPKTEFGDIFWFVHLLKAPALVIISLVYIFIRFTS
jgi:hypothetical protein